MHRLIETCSTSLARPGLIVLLLVLLGVPLACGGIVWMALAAAPALAELDSQRQNLVLVVFFFLIVFGLLGGSLLIWWLVIRSRAARLDAAFVPLGLQGSPYMLNGRHYYGQVQDRALEVYFYRGPSVELRLPISVQTRFHIAEKSAASLTLERIFHSQSLLLPGEWQTLAVYALDPAWMRQLLADPRAGAAVWALLRQGAPWALIRQIELLPGELVLHLDRNRQLSAYPLDLQETRAWLAAMLSLAQAAEDLPAPLVLAHPSGHNRAARMKLNRSLNIMIIGMLICFPLCAGLVFFAAVFLAN